MCILKNGCPSSWEEVREMLMLCNYAKATFSELTVVSNLLPFAKCKIELIYPLSKGRGSACYAIIIGPKIIEAATSKFFSKNIIVGSAFPTQS